METRRGWSATICGSPRFARHVVTPRPRHKGPSEARFPGFTAIRRASRGSPRSRAVPPRPDAFDVLGVLIAVDELSRFGRPTDPGGVGSRHPWDQALLWHRPTKLAVPPLPKEGEMGDRVGTRLQMTGGADLASVSRKELDLSSHRSNAHEARRRTSSSVHARRSTGSFNGRSDEV